MLLISRIVSCCRRGLGFVKMPPDGFSSFPRDHCGQRFSRGLLHVAQAAEVCQKALARERAYPGNVEQFTGAVAHGAALTVVADRETMALVPDHLHQVEHGRAAV